MQNNERLNINFHLLFQIRLYLEKNYNFYFYYTFYHLYSLTECKMSVNELR